MELWGILTGQALVSNCILRSRSAYHLVSVSPQRLFHICLMVEWKIWKRNIFFFALWKFCVKCLQHHKLVSWEDNGAHPLVCPLCVTADQLWQSLGGWWHARYLPHGSLPNFLGSSWVGWLQYKFKHLLTPAWTHRAHPPWSASVNGHHAGLGSAWLDLPSVHERQFSSFL